MQEGFETEESLIEFLTKFSKFMASRSRWAGWSSEEILSEAYLVAREKLIDRYDPQYGLNIESFLFHTIKKELDWKYRKYFGIHKIKGEYVREWPCGDMNVDQASVDGAPKGLTPVSKCIEEDIATPDDTDLEKITYINQKEREIIMLKSLGWTIIQIAKEVGMGKQTVINRIRWMREFIPQYLKMD
tara:strand:- start:690 stop:1250 length:561 start_codon:yes stop_codon:yes gene_type:complete